MTNSREIVTDEYTIIDAPDGNYERMTKQGYKVVATLPGNRNLWYRKNTPKLEVEAISNTSVKNHLSRGHYVFFKHTSTDGSYRGWYPLEYIPMTKQAVIDAAKAYRTDTDASFIVVTEK